MERHQLCRWLKQDGYNLSLEWLWKLLQCNLTIRKRIFLKPWNKSCHKTKTCIANPFAVVRGPWTPCPAHFSVFPAPDIGLLISWLRDVGSRENTKMFRTGFGKLWLKLMMPEGSENLTNIKNGIDYLKFGWLFTSTFFWGWVSFCGSYINKQV